MTPADWALLIILILSIVLAILTYRLANKGLSELLARTVSVPGGVIFFRRAFLLMLIYGGVQVVGESPQLKPGAHFIEFVWAVASGLQNCFGFLFLTLAIYLILMTILVAALKPKDDK